ncbi:amidohydrolase family protein [Mucilaginibacter auburnensis]|uniref:L-fuconolactonase n=1 Tax=Mucilaginibacter auburnensis TaxID=1457233 RepID=A0A2H9VQJ3_9SPHI|nr:amidohydrolase family protein [Mucilaginibacter auburnensis]PJJ83089.1 L-fuconolactonase [Mucilaginibacter auburnensis]
MLRIDAHQHFWKYNPLRDAWITDDMAVIQRDFMPQDLFPLLQENGLDGCVVVQSDESEAENDFQLANANGNDFVKGIVGWVELVSPSIEARLEYYSQFKKLKGFRHVLQGMPQRDFMLTDAFLKGISLLNKYNFTYDILIFPDQLKFAAEMVAKFPEQKFVLDHIAKPYIKDKAIAGWDTDIKALGKFENVYCKVSGMVTEANWNNWNEADFHPYMEVVTNAFGTGRLMFGSDWPVCTVAGTYTQVCDIVKNYFSRFSQTEQDRIWGENAVKFYSL